MKDIREINFEFLLGRYLEAPNVQRAARELDVVIGGGPEEAARLAHLLRDHKLTGLIPAEETGIRDDFDYLLSFYSVVEIACLVRYVPTPLPGEFVERALAHLTQESVARYYEEYYPILLPQLLRLRLEGKHDLHHEQSDEAWALFVQFLELNRALDEPEVGRFLWLLDDGLYRDRLGRRTDINSLTRVLEDPQTFARHLERLPQGQAAWGEDAPEPRTRLDEALHGYLIFLSFCQSFDALLARAAVAYPRLGAEMWYHRSYWFISLKRKLRSLVADTFSHMRGGWLGRAEAGGDDESLGWDGAGGPDGDGGAARRLSPPTRREAIAEAHAALDEQERTVERLVRGDYGAPLEAELGGLLRNAAALREAAARG